ncbi:hypothetical protein ACLKA7_015515 [Drosophila subpalustris]
MHIQSIIALCLIVCCVHISAQNTDCDKQHKSCVECARRVPQRDDINRPDACPKTVQDRWVWRRISQCEVQRLYCQNPGRKFTCDAIAEMAKMQRRATPRCRRCTTRRRTTRRTTRRSTRRTTRRSTTRRSTTRRSTTRRTTTRKQHHNH